MGLDSYLYVTTRAKHQRILASWALDVVVTGKRDELRGIAAKKLGVKQDAVTLALACTVLDRADFDLLAGLDAAYADVCARRCKLRCKLRYTKMAQWRKNWQLHEAIVRRHPGMSDNCSEFVLTPEDVDFVLEKFSEDEAVTAPFRKVRARMRRSKETVVIFYSWY